MNFFNIIKNLRGETTFDTEETNNRYQIIVNENNNTKTAYCFSFPIYEKDEFKLIAPKFFARDNLICLKGTNSIIEISDKVLFKLGEATCKISLPDKVNSFSESEISCGNSKIIPTANGIGIISPCRFGESIIVKLEAPTSLMPIRSNRKYFSLICGKFKPLITISSIGATNDGIIIEHPCELSFCQTSEVEFSICIKQTDKNSKYIFYEINAHEEKLIQDTTVESLYPTENNSFGSTGFIGCSKIFGEQWLYTRPEIGLLHNINGARINKAIMHIPSLNNSQISLSAYEISRRFCSFGSTWINKVDELSKISTSNKNQKYHSLDITYILSDKMNGTLSRTIGYLIKPTHKSDNYAAVATADCYIYPQILEINYSA